MLLGNSLPVMIAPCTAASPQVNAFALIISQPGVA